MIINVIILVLASLTGPVVTSNKLETLLLILSDNFLNTKSGVLIAPASAYSPNLALFIISLFILIFSNDPTFAFPSK